MVTKAFRLDWHFCQKKGRKNGGNDDKSQKPFGWIGISAQRKAYTITATGDWSQKPFGWIGISALRGEYKAQIMIQLDGHKSLSAGLAFLPMHKISQAEIAAGEVTKAFRLDWHFCLWHII